MRIIHLSTDEIRLASSMFFEKMTAIAQLSVAVLGGLWAFLSLADTRVSPNDVAGRVIFGAVTLTLVASLLSYDCGYDFIVTRIFYHSAFDIDAPIIRFWSNTQRYLFAHGVIGGCLLIAVWRKAADTNAS